MRSSRLVLVVVLWGSILVLLLLFLDKTGATATANHSPLTQAAATITVSSTADSGPNTLRQALLDATPATTITFNTTVFPPGAPATIQIQTPLPTITANDVVIDASNAGVILDGSQAPTGTNGLIINAMNIIIRGLTIRNFDSNGIFIASGAGSNLIGGNRNLESGPNGQGNLIILNGDEGINIQGNNNLVRGNYIGVDSTGQFTASNQFNGVAIHQGASNNTIGGTIAGYRNVIGGNGQNGVWIGQSGTNGNVVIGNYIGVTANGVSFLGNGFAGVAVQDGAQNNRIGDVLSGAGNLISGNLGNGIFVSDLSTSGNQILANIIGLNATGNAVIGQGLNGIEINHANNNTIGNGAPNGRNIVGGATFDGIAITGGNAANNVVIGNYIGTNAAGTTAMPNRLHGVELRENAHDNQIGGLSPGQGNVLSGNSNHGLVIRVNAHHNNVLGNLVGPDVSGSLSLGGHEAGGIDIADGAHDNVIESNVISGNQTDGIALFGEGTSDNELRDNLIGVAFDGISPLPNVARSERNNGFGILVTGDAVGTLMQGNVVANNESHGIQVDSCNSNRITQNSIYSNQGRGIKTTCHTFPTLKATSLTTLTGTTAPNARIEVFSDDDGEGRRFEGATTANGSGVFTYTQAGGFTGPNVTATSTDVAGNTSEFVPPQHLRWTVLLYLNGDNDLETFMSDVVTNVAAAGASPRANVLVLLDGAADNDTVLYDVTYGDLVEVAISPIFGASNELNLGAGETLSTFVNWSRSTYPTSYTMLSIVNHGGGWAPSSNIIAPGTLVFNKRARLAGSSGLSWDETGNGVDYDYLDSPEMARVMADIGATGGPLDVVFYDVCLMGMAEIAYQLKDHAAYFVSSQNIGWAPLGPQNRYVRTLQGLPPAATPQDMAQLLVDSYADAVPLTGHPLTVSAVDLSQMTTVATAVEQLGSALNQTLALPDGTDRLQSIYEASQKIDYDSDFRIESASEGFVDLYDFAQRAFSQYAEPEVTNAAQAVTGALDTAVVAEVHRSGRPWFDNSRDWNLDNVGGLSIFLPLGEDLEYQIEITDTSPITPGLVITRNLRLRDFYTDTELAFAGDAPAWRALIDTYYEVVATAVPTDTPEGPVDGVQQPDVTPPQTIITPSLTLAEAGEPLLINWTAVDTQTGVVSATLWHKPPQGTWTQTNQIQAGNGGSFTFAPDCGINAVAISAVDEVGNVEPVEHMGNTVAITTPVTGLQAQNNSPTALGQTTILTATISTGCDVSFLWEVGSSDLITGAVAAYTFPNLGQYSVTVTVSNTINTVTATTTVTVIDETIEGLVAASNNPVSVGQSAWFSATISQGTNVDYQWGFGDGSVPKMGRVVSHTYTSAGTYTATVTAENSNSQQMATTIIQIHHSIYLPLALKE